MVTYAEENPFPYILINESATDGSAVPNPATDYRHVFVGEDGLFHLKDSSGTITTGSAAGGAVATDAIWDAAGDLVQGTGADTAAKLTLGASGKVPTSNGTNLAYAYPPGYEFSYVEFTSPVTVSATSEATATTIVTSGAVTYSGSQRILVEFYAPYTVIASTENLFGVLYDGSGSIGKAWQGQVSAAGSDVIAPSFSRILTPSNASHTYSVRFYIQTTSGTVGAGAGGSGNYMPGYIRITAA